MRTGRERRGAATRARYELVARKFQEPPNDSWGLLGEASPARRSAKWLPLALLSRRCRRSHDSDARPRWAAGARSQNFAIPGDAGCLVDADTWGDCVQLPHDGLCWDVPHLRDPGINATVLSDVRACRRLEGVESFWRPREPNPSTVAVNAWIHRPGAMGVCIAALGNIS